MRQTRKAPKRGAFPEAPAAAQAAKLRYGVKNMNTKKLVALLLSLMLIISVLPVSAMAAEPWDGTTTTEPALVDGV